MSKTFYVVSLTIFTILHMVIGVKGINAQENKMQHASSLYNQGDFVEASSVLETMLENQELDKPTRGQANFLLGKCYEQRGKLVEAKQQFKLSIENGFDAFKVKRKSSVLKEAIYEQGLISAYSLNRDENYNKSNVMVDNVLILKLNKKEKIEPYFLLGRNYFRLNNREKAKAYFSKVKKIDKNYIPDPSVSEADEIIFFNSFKGGSPFWKKPIFWVPSGAALVTAGVILIICGGNKDFPDPPGRPDSN